VSWSGCGSDSDGLENARLGDRVVRGYRTLSPYEKEELLMIARLQKLNIYPQLVRRLAEGQSAQSVARWASELGITGAHWTFMYWRKQVTALSRKVDTAKDRILKEERRRTRLPEKPGPEAVLAKVDAVAKELTTRDALPESAQKVWVHVEGALRGLNAEQVLKYAFLRHMERLEKIIAAEDAQPAMIRIMQADVGTRAIKEMREIGDSLRKLEIGEEWMRGKGGAMPDGDPHPGALVPHAQPELSDIAKEMAQFDVVDRNLLREASVVVVEMIKEASGGRFKVSGVDFDAPGKVLAEKTATAMRPEL
jgi:hypothetical protein